MDDSDRFLLAQTCINRIEDYLEFRWKADSQMDMRHVLIGILADYAHDVSEATEDSE